MNIFNRFRFVLDSITDEKKRFVLFRRLGIYDSLSDEDFIKLLYRINLNKPLDLNSPKTFNEKLQWIKLNDRKKIYTTMVDKILAKEYISQKIGNEYVIPTLGSWDKAENIDFNNLPNQFVLKCNHNSGKGMYICYNKDRIHKEKIIHNLNMGLKEDYYSTAREWPYKDVKRKVLAETFLGSNLTDYRVYCFMGNAKIIYSYTNKSHGEYVKPEPLYCDYMDIKWNAYPFHQKYLPKGNISKPFNLNKMIEISNILSENTYFLRVDFYELGNQLYVGELTFFPGGGFSKFYPEEWDNILGEWICLNI